MKLCNDPKCLLNRQGVSHEIHELIENSQIKNPCMDGRCGLNRTGILHESHEGKQADQDSEFKNNKTNNFQSNPNSNKLSPEQVESERRRREQNSLDQEKIESDTRPREQNKLSREQVETERRRREQNKQPHSQTESEKITQKPKAKPGIFSRFSSKTKLPDINQILHSEDPYVVFGLKPDTTCDEVKMKFRELSRVYNASRGSINKSLEEKKQINTIQSRINLAYDKLRKKHCG